MCLTNLYTVTGGPLNQSLSLPQTEKNEENSREPRPRVKEGQRHAEVKYKQHFPIQLNSLKDLFPPFMCETTQTYILLNIPLLEEEKNRSGPLLKWSCWGVEEPTIQIVVVNVASFYKIQTPRGVNKFDPSSGKRDLSNWAKQVLELG